MIAVIEIRDSGGGGWGGGDFEFSFRCVELECLRDSQLEMTCVQVSIPERNLGKLKAAKGHIKSCDQICTGFNNSAPPIKEVPITSMRTE